MIIYLAKKRRKQKETMVHFLRNNAKFRCPQVVVVVNFLSMNYSVHKNFKWIKLKERNYSIMI